ncbi:hypothetical protein HAX54_025617 [Datura stramonium]|uniref:Uncharacterized protein n=1 Tax=Datura stramonium TaxID=4076 RepID=A0ABS8V1D3_DATST|nr:hypothetical protein [Datura stramonium]
MVTLGGRIRNVIILAVDHKDNNNNNSTDDDQSLLFLRDALRSIVQRSSTSERGHEFILEKCFDVYHYVQVMELVNSLKGKKY